MPLLSCFQRFHVWSNILPVLSRSQCSYMAFHRQFQLDRLLKVAWHRIHRHPIVITCWKSDRSLASSISQQLDATEVNMVHSSHPTKNHYYPLLILDHVMVNIFHHLMKRTSFSSRLFDRVGGETTSLSFTNSGALFTGRLSQFPDWSKLSILFRMSWYHLGRNPTGLWQMSMDWRLTLGERFGSTAQTWSMRKEPCSTVAEVLHDYSCPSTCAFLVLFAWLLF